MIRCPYCQDPFREGTPRLCPDCGTPYHHECWQENGGCAKIGCPSAASDLDATRHPVVPPRGTMVIDVPDNEEVGRVRVSPSDTRSNGIERRARRRTWVTIGAVMLILTAVILVIDAMPPT